MAQANKKKPAKPDPKPDPLTSGEKQTLPRPDEGAKVEPIQKDRAAITLSRFKQSEYARNVFCVTADPEHSKEQILNQNYWQHVGHLLKMGDRIEVMDDQMSYFLELMVIAADRLWAHVGVLRDVDLMKFHDQDAPPIQSSDYKVEFAGTHHQWRVLYQGEILRDGFASKALASRWASNHAQAQLR